MNAQPIEIASAEFHPKSHIDLNTTGIYKDNTKEWALLATHTETGTVDCI